jgi:tetraacyldisaccharide 4'-kinase
MTQTRTNRPLLLPLVPVYRLGVALRELRLRRGWETTCRLRHPVVSIGNLSTGGSGKTPFAIALAKLLTARGFHVDVLSRGYGRQSKSPTRVRTDGTAEKFGDEPLLIAREAGVPVYVAPQRCDAGLMAEAEFASRRKDDPAEHIPVVHILDDGFQHRQLQRDIDIVLMNRDDWQDRLLPAGNLREPLTALRRAQVIAIPADQPELHGELNSWGWTGTIWRIHRRMEVPPVDGPVAAFCGIARPEQFFAGLVGAGLRVAARTIFRDHHTYALADVQRLVSEGRRAGATAFLTTEKDQVRLGNLASEFPTETPLRTVRLEIEIEDSANALEGLTARLPAGSVAASL